MNLHLVEHSILANNASKVRVVAIYVYREWYKTILDVQTYIQNEWKKKSTSIVKISTTQKKSENRKALINVQKDSLLIKFYRKSTKGINLL